MQVKLVDDDHEYAELDNLVGKNAEKKEEENIKIMEFDNRF